MASGGSNAPGWDIKKLQRLIVTSATYRQSSRITAAALRRDPDNRLLGRASIYRLDAETIRDNALAIGGLLTRAVGGPSVRPYQPAGLWEQVAVGGNYTSQTYVESTGPDLYRRGLYTYWKRSLPSPALVAFDAPTRELCTACRSRTNTPVQALVLLNDPTYVEAARGLAERVLREAGPDVDAQLTHAFRLCTSRPPAEVELAVLRRVVNEQCVLFERTAQDAAALIRVGASTPDALVDQRRLAAWTAVANLLLNLNETITRR